MGETKYNYVIDIGDLSIWVTRKRVKNVNFRMGQDGVARMSVPMAMAPEEARRVAQEHEEWFRRARCRVGEAAVPAPLMWETGEKLMLWGEPVSLRVEPCEALPYCELCGNELVVCASPGYHALTRAEFVKDWLVSQLSARVAEVVPECEERVGRRASGITLRFMKTRWGSCTPKTARIRLNTALIHCPPACLEMVVVHELCHLLEASHGPRFHALMDLHCPDWRASQRWLDEHPPQRL